MNLRDQIKGQFTVEREMGDEMLISCPHPDHDDHNPSASVNVKKRLWVCYSCGNGGTVQSLLRERVVDETVEELLAEVQTNLTTKGEEQVVYPESWLDQFDLAGVHPYWTSRGLSDDVCRLFRLGYDPTTGRATYPLRDPTGRVWGVSGRATGDQMPKYKYPSHAPVSQTLFGYHLVQGHRGDVVLTEGALDAIAMWDIGVPALALLGSRMSRDQARLLRMLSPLVLVLAFDRDEPGEKATQRVLDEPDLRDTPIAIMAWDPTVAKDPLDLTPQQRLDAYNNAFMV